MCCAVLPQGGQAPPHVLEHPRKHHLRQNQLIPRAQLCSKAALQVQKAVCKQRSKQRGWVYACAKVYVCVSAKIWSARRRHQSYAAASSIQLHANPPPPLPHTLHATSPAHTHLERHHTAPVQVIQPAEHPLAGLQVLVANQGRGGLAFLLGGTYSLVQSLQYVRWYSTGRKGVESRRRREIQGGAARVKGWRQRGDGGGRRCLPSLQPPAMLGPT